MSKFNNKYRIYFKIKNKKYIYSKKVREQGSFY